MKNLLENPLYAGYFEHPEWDIPLTKGHHEGLINYETFQRIQARMAEKAYVVTTTDLSEDFPLRGFVTCSECGHPMSAYWAKGRSRRYPYYECFQKGCSLRRKSIARDRVEHDFTELLTSLRPSKGLITLAERVFRDLWDHHRGRAKVTRQALERQNRSIEEKTIKLLDRIAETDNTALISTYEARLSQLDAEKAIIAEKIAVTSQKQQGFEKSFRTAMDFLVNPCNLSESSRLEDKKCVLKLVFSAPLPYVRNKGFRTAKTTKPFKVLQDFSNTKKVMADLSGESSNTLFDELERWEECLKPHADELRALSKPSAPKLRGPRP